MEIEKALCYNPNTSPKRRITLRNELDFAEHSHLLGEGLFADKVILALSRFSKTQQLGEQERQALEKAKDFLSEVIEGGNFSQGVFHSARDVTSAKAFKRAVDAVSIQVSSKSDFLRYLDELKATVTKILANEHTSDEQLALVDAFFSRYGRMQFQRSRGMLESV